MSSNYVLASSSSLPAPPAAAIDVDGDDDDVVHRDLAAAPETLVVSHHRGVRRGIKNVGGTSCHTSSALQLLYHCFPAVTESLLDLAPTSAGHCHRRRTTTAEHDGGGEAGGGGGDDVIRREFVYRLSWFYHMLAYSEDVLEIHRGRQCDYADADADTDADAEASIVAAAADGGARGAEEGWFVRPPAGGSEAGGENDGGGGDDDDEGRETTTTSSSGGATRPSFLLRPSRVRESSSSLGANDADDAHGAVLEETARIAAILEGGSMRRGRRKKPATATATASSSAGGGSRRGASARTSAEGGADPPPPRIGGDDDRGTSSAKKEEGEEDARGPAPSSSSSGVRHRRRRGIAKTSELNSVQRAALAAYFAAVKGGAATRADWRSLVDLMKSADNRAVYDVTLGMVLRTDDGEKGGGAAADDDEIRGGNLGGGRGEFAAADDGDDGGAIDPTDFYRYLSSNDSNAITINTNNVGDAASVFRSLISLLERSVRNELGRLLLLPSETKIRLALERVQSAMQESWSGMLVSRIVGTSSASVTVSVADNPTIPTSTSTPTTAAATTTATITTITTTTTMRRTKKNGKIKRPLPVPLPLPVINTRDRMIGMTIGPTKENQRRPSSQDPPSSRGESSNSSPANTYDNTSYFPSLVEALHSITVEPSPIRGFNWSGLMERGEMIEETHVRRFDGEGREIIELEDDEKKDELFVGVASTAAAVHLARQFEYLEITDPIQSSLRWHPPVQDGNDDVGIVKNNPALEYIDEDDVFLNAVNNVVDNENNMYDTTEEDWKAASMAEHEDKRRSHFGYGGASVSSVETRSVACQTVATQSVACQTDFDCGEEEELGEEDEDLKDTAEKQPKLEIAKDAHYAAAVAALMLAKRGSSIASRHGRTSRALSRSRGASLDSRTLGRDASVESRDRKPIRRLSVESGTVLVDRGESGTEVDCVGPPVLNGGTTVVLFGPRVPGLDTPLDMEVGPCPLDARLGIVLSYSPSPTGSLGDDAGGLLLLPSDSGSSCSSSDEESSVDSHVTSVKTNSSDDKSFQTKSSAIETPSDIDDISLGSFTDDSFVDGDEKSDIQTAIQINDVAPGPVEEATALDKRMKENEKDPLGMEVDYNAGPASKPPAIKLINYNSPSSSSDESESNDSGDDSSSSDSDDDSSSTEEDSSSSSSEESSSTLSTTSSKSENRIGEHTDVALSTIPVTDIVGCSDNGSYQSNANEWITRKETRLCVPLPRSLIFHLKRFEYSTVSGRVEKLHGAMEIPAELDVTACSTVTTPLRYCLTGAIVHVDPIENDHEAEFGVASEGHYVTIIRSKLPTSGGTRENDDPQGKGDNLWTEFDDDYVSTVDSDNDTSSSPCQVPKAISGCDVTKSGQVKGDDGKTTTKIGNAKERRYATLVVYSRACEG